MQLFRLQILPPIGLLLTEEAKVLVIRKVSFILILKLRTHFELAVSVTLVVSLHHLHFCTLTLPLSVRLMSTIQEVVASK
jgi:hypothetical protein